MIPAAASVISDPSEIFENMVLSTAFDPRSATIEEKRQIFRDFWKNDVGPLLANFNSAGMRPGTGDAGFGFLVEAFARRSVRLPKLNTPKAEAIAQAILSAFRDGRRSKLIQLNVAMNNSDYLWLEQTGRRITIIGIGEVKASYLAAVGKIGGQLQRQERELEILVEELRLAKANNRAHDLFKNRNVVVAENFERFLIVPFGQGEKIRQDDKFSHWQVVELEFGYDELVFIAQQIWPDFRSNIRFGPGKLFNLFEIANTLSERWTRSRVDHDFGVLSGFNSDDPLPLFETGLFFLATGKTPLHEEWLVEDAIRWSAELVRKCFWSATQGCLNFLNSTSSRRDFSERETRMFQKFWYLLTNNREDLEHFIYFLRHLDAQIEELVRERHQIRQLKNMAKVWTI